MMKTKIINRSSSVLELKGASGLVGLRQATAIARKSGKPVLVRYSLDQINGVNPNGTYCELERDTWEKNDPSKPFRYLPGKYFASVEDFERQMRRLSH